MKVYLNNQESNFPAHLNLLKAQPVSDYDITRLTEKTSSIIINTDKDLAELDTGFFFEYKIFPPHIMLFLTQWSHEQRQMNIGDTIIQQAFIPPAGFLSQKIIVGVRIKEIIHEPNKMGFSYETIRGHVEKGISTFTIEKLAGKTVFRIHTFSKPGTLLSKLAAPFFSIPYQSYCTRQALKYVRQQLENHSLAGKANQ
ncbi:DUF1990 family protein [Terrimonas pollutisoli]|uniref:DUF1990 family protein n=1 Tax=Terrimonas pollutisoli TaxID=3034147 RepID=UPI0023ED8B3C|nr:DUF1990 family protein [Terrimonas sp. H1YJ31]